MTLIVAAITKKRGFMFADQTRTVEGSVETPVEVKIGNVNIKSLGNLYINESGTKLKKICQEYSVIGCAGEECRTLSFFDELKSVQTRMDAICIVNDFWINHKNSFPQESLMLSKNNNEIFVDSFALSAGSNRRYLQYGHSTFVAEENRLQFFAIGSGAEAFIAFTHQNIDGIESEFIKAEQKGNFESYRQLFVSKIKSMFEDVHHQISSVGNLVDVVELVI